MTGLPDGDTPSENNLPMCWDYINPTTDESLQYLPAIFNNSDYTHAGNNYMGFASAYAPGTYNDPQPQYAILRPMEDVSVLKMSFYAKCFGFTSTFHVGVMVGTDVNTFSPFETFSATGDYEEYTVTFAGYTGNGKRIAIKMDAADANKTLCELFIDDITLSKYIVDVDAYHDFTDNFENGLEWELANGELTNVWCLGTAAHNGLGTQGLYISNDGGTTNVYNNTSPSMVYAYKTFRLEAGYHEFSYDWLANGEWTWDFLRVALVPETVNLEASTSLPAGLTYTQMPDGWIALDGGIQLGLTTEWQTVSNDIEVLEAGLYKMVFAWRNDGSQGNNPPAAIDNFSLSVTTCPNPTNLAVSNITATTADVSWTNGVESYTLQYRPKTVKEGITFFDSFKNGQGDWSTYNLEDGSSNYQGQASGWGFWDGCFAFIYNTNPPQYLISPEINVEHNNSTLCFQYFAMNGHDYPETFRVGFSSTDNNVGSFTWGEKITSTTTMNDMFEEYAVTIPNDAKYFAIQYTSNDMLALMLDNFIICDTYALGEWVTVENVTSPVTIEGLTPETVYEWQVQGVCDDGETDWVNGAPFMTLEQPMLTQTLNLSAGVNWVSFYVETTLNDLKTALLSALNNASGIKITSHSNGFTSWNGSSWRGSLNSIDVSQMYVIEVPATCAISLEAMPIDPAAHPITIVNGTNWIGFPLSADMTLTNAFNGFAVNGDKVSSLNNGSANYQGSWSGGLMTLQPGQGYKLEVTTTGQRTLVFPTGAKKAKPFIPMGK